MYLKNLLLETSVEIYLRITIEEIPYGKALNSGAEYSGGLVMIQTYQIVSRG
jgi:hypothetical protein